MILPKTSEVRIVTECNYKNAKFKGPLGFTTT